MWLVCHRQMQPTHAQTHSKAPLAGNFPAFFPGTLRGSVSMFIANWYGAPTCSRVAPDRIRHTAARCTVSTAHPSQRGQVPYQGVVFTVGQHNCCTFALPEVGCTQKCNRLGSAQMPAQQLETMSVSRYPPIGTPASARLILRRVRVRVTPLASFTFPVSNPRSIVGILHPEL
jgi:hypothetical protein